MRVALISGSYPPDPCGVGDYTARLAKALIDTGVDVKLLVPRSATPAPDDQHVEPVISSFRIRETARLAALVADLAPDIVHVQYPTLLYGRTPGSRLLPALLHLWARRSRVVVTIHEPAKTYVSLAYNSLPLLAAHGVIFVERNNLYAQWGRFRNAVAQKRVVQIIPIASNMPVARLTPPEAEGLRQRLGVPKGGVMMCYFGQIKAAKGVHLFPEILRRLPGAHLVMIGPIENGRFAEELRAALSRPILASRVHFLGYLPPEEVARHLAAADVAVFPLLDGHVERSGSVLAAASQGTFTVTCHPTLRGLHGNMYYAAPGDVDQMVSAIRHYAGMRTAPHDVGEHWERIATQHVALYESLLGRGRPGS